MNKDDVLKAINLRTDYLKIVCKAPKSIDDIQHDVSILFETILQFTNNCDKCEFDREVIDLCSQLIFSISSYHVMNLDSFPNHPEIINCMNMLKNKPLQEIKDQKENRYKE